MSEEMDERALLLKASRGDDGTIALLSPSPAYFRGALVKGALVSGGAIVGELIVLGRSHRAVVPEGVSGRVVEHLDDTLREPPCEYGERLLLIDPTSVGEEEKRDVGNDTSAEGLVLRAKMGGRFYRKPAPDQPDFVKVGDEITIGTTLGLLEVMKTFHRI
ncbi:MAG: hypothetical protein GX614_14385, partial [Sandaracinaceae bacterium]|nr:hypothetical protein [Sandaracinaceae bacterium]